jgi:uncharacterized protein YbjT (DUF2867 family)
VQLPKLDVLVVGATGRQGNAVARALLRAGFNVRALTRNLAHPTAEALRLRGARLAWADLDDASRLSDVMRGVRAVYAVTTPFVAGPAAEVRQGRTLVDVSQRLGVEHFIYSSVPAAARMSGVPHHDSKHEVERYLRSSGLPYSVLSSAFFMENLLGEWWKARLSEGLLPLPFTDTQKLQQTALADVGSFVRLMLERRAEFLDRRVCIASDEVTPLEMAAMLARVFGRTLRHVTPGTQQDAADAPLSAVHGWGDAGVGAADVEALRREFPEVNWHTLNGWASRQDWSP